MKKLALIPIGFLAAYALSGALITIPLSSSASQLPVTEVSGYMRGFEQVTWVAVPGATGYQLIRDGVQVSTAGPSANNTRFYVTNGNHTLTIFPIVPSSTTTATTTPVTTTAPVTTTVAQPPAQLHQGYTATEVAALRQAGNIVAPQAYSVTFPDSSTARFEVRSGDQYSTWSGERAQLQLPGVQGKEGDHWHWRFSFTLAPGFQFSNGFYNVLFENHHTGSTGSPPSTLQLNGNQVVWRQVKSPDPAQSIYWTETPLAISTPGTPMLVDVDETLSTDATKARTVVTVNGTAHTIGGPTLLSGMNVYVEWGLYRAPSPLTQTVTFGPVDRLF